MVIPKMLALTDKQARLAEMPLEGSFFLEGPAGAGKTTAAIARLTHLVSEGVPGQSVMILVPQLTLASPYAEAVRSPDMRAGGQPTVLTFGGLARRTVELFWPMLASEAEFGNPDRPPTFLTLELAQYYMAQIVTPYIEKGYFENITIDRNRLYSEVLDNLNKAAIVGFSHHEIASRLKQAWAGNSSLLKNFDQAQVCAEGFRALCLERNLLDFSLQIELFRKLAWNLPLCRENIIQAFRHLIVDNVEEDTPAMHDTLEEWLPFVDSALLVYDQNGGHRRFLGADPNNAYELKTACDRSLSFEGSFVTSQGLRAVERSLTLQENAALNKEVRKVLIFDSRRFYPEMIGWVAQMVRDLIAEQNAAPSEIAVLAPYLSDSIRFSLVARLEALGVQSYSQRPSRALREEPATTTLLTLASLAHTEWGYTPTKEQVRQALVGSISGLDLVRARLITEILYRPNIGLQSFEGLKHDAQERITFAMGRRYERLREYLQPDPERGLALDSFLGAIFGELLSQPGYGFHNDFEAGAITANLIDSVRRFRLAVGSELRSRGLSADREYVDLVRQGLIAAQYLRSWESQPDQAVLLAPAYTFLLANRPVDYQIWVNVGGRGWWERPYQPLTHPYVLSRQWSRGQRWMDQDEMRTRKQIMQVLTQGLIRRCRKAIFFGLSELNEYGTEEHGPLLDALQRTVLSAR